MFDHLSSEPDQPGDDVRAAVAARALRIRRRRWALAGTTLATVTGVALALTLGGGSAPRSTLVGEGPTATATPTVEPQAPLLTPVPLVTLHSTPSPATTPRAAVPPTTGPTPAPTPSPTCNAGPFPDCPDGTSGWNGGFTSCHNAGHVLDGSVQRELFNGISGELVLPARVAAGSSSDVVLRLTNTTDHTISFTLEGDATTSLPAFGPGGGSAVHTTDVIANKRYDLKSGQSVTNTYSLIASRCGDTSSDPEPALAPGDYAVGLLVRWTDVVDPAATQQSGAPQEASAQLTGSVSIA